MAVGRQSSSLEERFLPNTPDQQPRAVRFGTAFREHQKQWEVFSFCSLGSAIILVGIIAACDERSSHLYKLVPAGFSLLFTGLDLASRQYCEWRCSNFNAFSSIFSFWVSIWLIKDAAGVHQEVQCDSYLPLAITAIVLSAAKGVIDFLVACLGPTLAEDVSVNCLNKCGTSLCGPANV